MFIIKKIGTKDNITVKVDLSFAAPCMFKQILPGAIPDHRVKSKP